ncbi:helix-turn-helix domain-containing protein [Paradesertivirga mongoliensis]|uniref:Helix-turn-helix domain-containing protein n=1 Tax=Paradesertivirga mongoliensis TaxID=2100740 RepID=A0ABW4ZMG5_9SPHI|nr:helix-turn-helix domain-containing protein [Pedobacter mongoliensis]
MAFENHLATHDIYQPHPALRSYIRYYWSLGLNLPTNSMLSLQLMADRFPRLIIQCLDGKNALHGYHNQGIFPASLKGVTSKPALLQMEPKYSHIAVSFFPHAVKAFFGVDAQETTDAVLDMNHFCPNEGIEQLISATSHQMRIKILDAFFLKRLDFIKKLDKRVIDFLQLSSVTSYAKLLAKYKISERQFERIFLQTVGFTPSFYKRVLRFERTLYTIQQGQFESLTDLAYELGYSDQSHFNREFKKFTTLTPKKLLSKTNLLEDSGSILSE